ncbi:hypothetical protein [Nocardia sp. NBC_00511]|uniref:phage tail fiber protein n=1 Tax=Nocardia sp. NBC_00511 TaxID=2903591 RepID=UPI0030DEDA6E
MSIETIVAVFVQLHVGNPGLDGTANPSAMTTRLAAQIDNSGEIAVTGPFTMTARERISDLSLWSAAVAGDFLWAVPLRTTPHVVNGDTLSIASLSLPVGVVGQLLLDYLRQEIE